jgi:hypothetical protein
VLDGRAVAHWDPGQDDWEDVQAMLPDLFNHLSPPVPRRQRGWHVDAGRYDLLVGRSSEDIAASGTIRVADAASWS